MGAHRKTFQRLSVSLMTAADEQEQNRLLDQWLDAKYLATEYDADLWGLNPDDPIWSMERT